MSGIYLTEHPSSALSFVSNPACFQNFLMIDRMCRISIVILHLCDAGPASTQACRFVIMFEGCLTLQAARRYIPALAPLAQWRNECRVWFWASIRLMVTLPQPS